MIQFAAGVLTWTLAEYLIHRFIAHHYETCAHHEDPLDYSVGPSWLQIIAMLFAPSGIFAILGIMWAWVGFVAGFCAYALLHYIMHHGVNHSTWPKWLTRLTASHYYHHYFDDTRNYGVTSPLWDHVFRTERRSHVPHP
jgi:sterol desaturase/sphingolipid hydroxylase (fatty acid hydroxylase superfamily)